MFPQQSLGRRIPLREEHVKRRDGLSNELLREHTVPAGECTSMSFCNSIEWEDCECTTDSPILEMSDEESFVRKDEQCLRVDSPIKTKVIR